MADSHQDNPDESDPTEGLEAILFEHGPWGNVDAVVQHDLRALYFYLNGETLGTRACWVRNLVAGPLMLSKQELEDGVPPLMPRTHCRSPEPQPLPDPEEINVVWFEEGNGAALYERDELIAVIPPWSGTDGFHGYAAECVAENQLAWPLPESPELLRRIENAAEFWDACGDVSRHPFAQLQPMLMDCFRSKLGEESGYFSLDDSRFPPCGAAIFHHHEKTLLVSVGMAFRPQPNVELFVEHPREFRRIELAVELPEIAANDLPAELLQQFSGLVGYPWQNFTWFGEGHSCEFDSLARLLGSEDPTTRFVSTSELAGEAIDLPEFRGDPIRLLKLVP